MSAGLSSVGGRVAALGLAGALAQRERPTNSAVGLVVSFWAKTMPSREMLTWLSGLKPVPIRVTASSSW